MIGVRLVNGAIDLTKFRRPKRLLPADDGGTVEERLPAQRSLYMVNPQGHCVWVAMHSGSGNRAENDPMALRILSEKGRQGFIRVDTCPQGAVMPEVLPAAIRNRAPCKVAASGGPIGIHPRGGPCACVAETIRVRREAHAVKMSEAERRYQTQEARERERANAELKGTQSVVDKLADVVGRLAERAEAPAPKGGGK